MARLLGALVSPLVLAVLLLSMRADRSFAQEAVSFLQPHFTFSVSENAGVGTLVGILRAGTTNPEGAIVYSISGNASEPFSTSAIGGIVLMEPLDAEGTTNYTFLARAVDGQDMARALVTVLVTDVNDNAPVWEPIKPQTIAESTPPNTRIATLNATDADQPPNNIIHYAIVVGNEDGLFSLNGDILQLERRPDFEQRTSYTLVLQATDSGTPMLSTSTVLQITISDTNEPPMIVAEPATVHVSEDVAVGTTLASVSAVDPDAGQVLRIAVEPAAFNETFAISKDGHRLLVTQPLDAETRQRYELTLTVTDSGSPPLTANTQVTVVVGDVNEHAPRFQPSNVTTTIPETHPVGDLVQRLQVVDKDVLGHATNYTFSLVQPDPSPFFRLRPGPSKDAVDVISVSPFDYEMRKSYELVLRATYTQIDGNTNTTDAALHVIIEDRNDPPVFSQRQYHATVSFPVHAGAQVATVSATDMEGDPFVYSLQGITYTSPADGAVTLGNLAYFGIADTAGYIRTQTLDLMPGTYSLRVRAQDAANQVSHVVVTITFVPETENKEISLVEDESGSLDIRTANREQRVFINGVDVLRRLDNLNAAAKAAARHACRQGAFASQGPTGFSYPPAEGAPSMRTLAWDSAVVAPNGFVFAMPTDATAVAIIDPKTGAVDTTTIAGFPSTGPKWGGAVLAGDGNIYAVPALNPTMLVVDPDRRVASTVPVQVPEAAAMWRAAVLTATGKVCAIPWRDTPHILLFDPATNMSDTTLEITGSVVNGGWRSAVLADNKKIYAPPRRAAHVLVVEPETGAVTTLSVPGFDNNNEAKWQSALLAKNGLIYCIPSHKVGAVLIIDPATSSVDTTTVSPLPLPSVTHAWGTAVLTPSGLIYGLPVAGDAVLTVNPDRNAHNYAAISVRSEGKPAYRWATASTLPDGRIVALSRDGNATLILDTSTCAESIVWP